ncbi:MAG: hypothetical protein LBK27_03730 [Treponema sp.]|jgi:hypothetical protein|nr:hypothetical protein [Treponema sp.]
MTVFLFSSRKTSPLKGESAASPQMLSLDALAKHRPEGGDLSLLDISGLAADELKKACSRLKKTCAASDWGIVDPRGEAPDPAAFFFEGASDYIGPGLIKGGWNKKRMAAALSWRQDAPRAAADSAASAGSENGGARKFPGGKFEGWKSIHTGTTASFLFLFFSLSGTSNLRAHLGERAITAVQNRLRDTLQQNLQESQALLWMESEFSSLFLVPPRGPNARAAVEASLRMIAGCRLIGIEKLGLSMPINFTFALHYGKTVFRAPGKTGTIVSDAVNYIFHLGNKKAEPGRLTISADVSGEAIPERLKDLFVPAGIYEELPIRHSRLFRH